MSEMLIAENVSKCFRVGRTRYPTIKETLIRRLKGEKAALSDVWALRNVNFSVSKGQSLGIIGHNGAGKSTLLRLLCGLGRPSSGRIHRTGSIGSLLELGSGFDPELSGRENLMTSGILSGLRKRQVLALQDDIIAFAELEESIDQPVRTYSSGMYVRLAFASAIRMDYDILVIDEILAVGDSRFQKKCIEQLTAFRKSGKTIVLASHDLDQVKHLCDDVIVLEDGHVAMQGDPENAIPCYHDLMRKRTERRATMISDGHPPEMRIEQGERLGTLEACVERVSLLDAADRPIESIETGKPLTIDLDYRLAPPVSNIAILLGIYTEANIKCFEVAIPSASDTFGRLPAKGCLRCTFSNLPLSAGHYYINLGFYPTDWNYIYDYHWQMHSLYVTCSEGGTAGQSFSGPVAMKPLWTLQHDVRSDTL
ncbi:ABC transporter ATP-binding protein [Desulfatirhabdium butyrativorans]|uniref:ABC transporter ATP-binding protein n=1 Tax=Desulfatirhabdium butyrativorans TaxID=340467 RepID=UPI0003F740E5|nr:ABC transporter ATP-binding protein [Desulfatirhabdium butyrativorans]